MLLAQEQLRFTPPVVSYRALAPVLCVLGAALLGVVVEAAVPAARRHATQLTIALLGLAGALGTLVWTWDDRLVAVAGAIAVDGPALFLQGTIVALAVGSLLLVAESGAPSDPDADRPRQLPSESFPLAMFSVAGMMLMTSASNLLVLFVALEMLSFPLYLLSGLARRRRLQSQESALKYFLLGSFGSAFLLYGIALVYGYAGGLDYRVVHDAAGTVGGDALLYSGLATLSVGLLFKVGAVPFHAWTPDVYQGAPTPVTALMAAGTKVAAFGGLLRVMFVAFEPLRWDWRPAMWVVAILTMLLGAVVAVTQTEVKRMLAYSSIAHAGFVLTGVVAANRVGLRGVLFYLLCYGFIVLGAFGIVTLVRDAEGEATHLSQWQGLGRRSPVVAGTFALFLFALAGIPLTSGFSAKFAVFSAAVEGHATGLVIVGVISSAVAAFFYARVVVLMFFQEPVADGPQVVVPGTATTMALSVSLAVTILLGVLPGQVLRLVDDAAQFVR